MFLAFSKFHYVSIKMEQQRKTAIKRSALNSTMFLLRSEGGVAIENNCLFSKFHYVSIKMANDMMSFSNYKHSKFHYVSIKMGQR